MRQTMGRPTPAMVVALVALFAALSGTVYAAGKGKKINGRTIKVKSLPGNRLLPGSVPGDRLKQGSIPVNRLMPGAIQGIQLGRDTVGGAQIDESSLGQVPSALHAESAESAVDAQTALNAVNAINATTVNGHEVGCIGTVYFAGACWETKAREGLATAIEAAVACANDGGELPNALLLAAFAGKTEVKLDPGGEWSSDIPVFSGPNTFGVITVSGDGNVESASANSLKHYRCVLPLIN